MQPVRIAAVLAVAASGLLFGPGASVAVGAEGTCSPSDVSPDQIITWTGQSDAHPHAWDEADNWQPKTVPDAQQIKAIYSQDYACIGKDHKGNAPTVEIPAGDSYHLAGLAVGQGAQLTIEPGAGLFLGSANSADVVDSTVDADSGLRLLASTLGGNAPLTVNGTLQFTGHKVGKHEMVATQTSSECVFDPTIPACPGDTTPGGGDTTIANGGTMLVDGTGFGGTVLGDDRYLFNAGTVSFSNAGYVRMNNNTQWTDEPGSTLSFFGSGGIYDGVAERSTVPPSFRQAGGLLKDSKGTSVLGIPVTFTKGKQKVRVKSGTLDLQGTTLPTAKVARGAGYGIGTCTSVTNRYCRLTDATNDDPELATVVTSTAGPKKSKIDVALADGPAKVKGSKVLGQAIDITAPTEKTTHSTHLLFTLDGSVKHATTRATVFRGTKPIPLCRVHGLTAVNTSCVTSEKIQKGGSGKGDLEIIVITIQPNSRWLIAN